MFEKTARRSPFTRKRFFIVLYIVVAVAFVYYNFPKMSSSESNNYKALARDIKALVDEKGCHPILVRLAWHDAGTFDKSSNTGGSRAAMRLKEGEAKHDANKGLQIARDLLQPIKDKHPDIDYADFWQFAGIVAIEAAGGPHIPFKAGRKDTQETDEQVPSGRLPDASKGADHLRAVFGKMGLEDQDIVALSGAHALGRAHKDRTGYDGPWTTTPLKFGNTFFTTLVNNKWVEREGFTPKQYEDEATRKLMMLPTDLVLIEDPAFKVYVERYAKDQDAFFADFTKSWIKLSENGHSNLHVVEW